MDGQACGRAGARAGGQRLRQQAPVQTRCSPGGPRGFIASAWMDPPSDGDPGASCQPHTTWVPSCTCTPDASLRPPHPRGCVGPPAGHPDRLPAHRHGAHSHCGDQGGAGVQLPLSLPKWGSRGSWRPEGSSRLGVGEKRHMQHAACTALPAGSSCWGSAGSSTRVDAAEMCNTQHTYIPSTRQERGREGRWEGTEVNCLRAGGAAGRRRWREGKAGRRQKADAARQAGGSSGSRVRRSVQRKGLPLLPPMVTGSSAAVDLAPQPAGQWPVQPAGGSCRRLWRRDGRWMQSHQLDPNLR